MKISIFKGFEDAYRASMTLYAEALIKNLRPCLQPSDTIEGVSPFPSIASLRIARYVCQYGFYPVKASLKQGDVNHVTDHSYAHLLYGLQGQKTVVTFHDAIWLKTRNGHFEETAGKLRWIRSFNLKALSRAARIICDSEASRRALLQVLDYPEEKAVVIPLGLNESFLKSNIAADAQVRNLGSAPVLLHVGHTQSYKNIPALFHVLAELKRKSCPARLVKVGTAFTGEQEKMIRDLGITDCVTHFGKIGEERLPSIYKAADILLQPSLDEGFGFPVLEAMACGVPVVASNRGSLPELIGGAGILKSPDDYAGMADAVCRVLAEPSLRKDLAEKGRERAGLYSWKKTAEKTFEVYRSVLNG